MRSRITSRIWRQSSQVGQRINAWGSCLDSGLQHFDNGDAKGTSFAGAGGGFGNDFFALQQNGDRLFPALRSVG